MPHATYSDRPDPGLQAIILCGPGSSFPTFTASPDENPKALLPIANRPMVWYPIDFCYRMGIKNITIVTPPSSTATITAAFNTNPHLTSLDLPKPLSPKDLDQTTGTAQILRLPEVRAAIKKDFIILPCDLVCELEGQALLNVWMRRDPGIGAATGGGNASESGEDHGRKPGLGVWYDTKSEPVIKGEETDFIATTALPKSEVPPSKSSIVAHVSKLIYSVPTDTLNDLTEAKNSLPLRHGLMRAHPRLRMLSGHRDAHIYIFPAWVVDMVNSNEHMDSIGEDVIGWWAKAEWQVGLADKLGFREGFDKSNPDGPDDNSLDNAPKADVDFQSLSSTWTSDLSRALPTESSELNGDIPPILAYIHPKSKAEGIAPLLRRVDTAPLLLSVSLQLAKLEAIDAAGRDASPFAHQKKVAYPEGIASRTTVTRPDCLLAENVKVEEKCSVKECVIGANCHIKEGAKLFKCVLMDGVVVGKGCKLNGCILGRMSVVGQDSELTNCEVQENLLLEPKTEEKNYKFMSSDAMEESFHDEAPSIDAEQEATLDP
ncbi:nucleotide-diphospho-sugar transferase [Amylocarpus encephaloides]|uniref:Translation initiation factor eIF2B subunit gamma n=1 Tax=Amylocarpus encephaloides TaxID=45428 RepID=A0A9P8C4N8_9HELO|nr:nucleotide-diphospho-sugar transferase [Amylocarpus encephaloides]